MNIFTTKILSILGVFLAFIVIGLGAWTRLADAGLGCPDWPGCYGFITFPTTSQEIEMAEQLYPDSPVEIDKIIPEVVHTTEHEGAEVKSVDYGKIVGVLINAINEQQAKWDVWMELLKDIRKMENKLIEVIGNY